MESLLVKAKFKGANGSVGYKNGETYTLRFYIKKKKVVIHNAITEGLTGKVEQTVEYNSLPLFLINWDVVYGVR